MVMESVWGLGEGLVSGSISPERVVYDWSLDVTTAHNRVPQETKYVPVDHGSGRSDIAVVACAASETAAGPLSSFPGLVVRLVEAGHTISGAQRRPQDVEWCFDGETLVGNAQLIGVQCGMCGWAGFECIVTLCCV